MNFKIGDIVRSKWNTYDNSALCVVDRIYQRKDKMNMLRLKFIHKGEEKMINVPAHTCKIDLSHNRNLKLNKLFGENNQSQNNI